MWRTVRPIPRGINRSVCAGYHEGMEQDRESLGAASKALAEAASQLAHALGSQARQAADAGTAFSDAVTSSLRGAAADISAASATLSEQVSRRDDRRPRKADQTRADLLAAGARVFAARGFEGASVDDIARDAGYTKGAVYAHFGSKRDLFLAIALGSVAATSHCDALPGLETGAIDEPALAGHLVRLGEDPAMLLALEILATRCGTPTTPPNSPPPTGRPSRGSRSRWPGDAAPATASPIRPRSPPRKTSTRCSPCCR